MNTTTTTGGTPVFVAGPTTDASPSWEGLWFSPPLSPRESMFESAWSIYHESFDDFEQRTWLEQMLTMRRDHYRFSAILARRRTVVGLLGMWDLGEFRFIEHFAIASTHRSGGIGGRAMRSVQKVVSKPIILDVAVYGSTPDAARRIRFYRNLGFHYCCTPVTLPPYIGKTTEPSCLMSWPSALDQREREYALYAIQHEVYGSHPTRPRRHAS